ncbi:MAG: hypothetical protein AB7I50_20615 [Vicinamibacterales bacterium]
MKLLLLASLVACVLAVAPSLVAPVTLEARQASTADLALGTVRINRDVVADGKPLKAGTYRLRLSSEPTTPVPTGQSADLERWVEFLRGNTVVGREIVSVVPQSEIQIVAQDAPPPVGMSKVQMLKGNEYLRIWINRGGNHYLIHLPTSSARS